MMSVNRKYGASPGFEWLLDRAPFPVRDSDRCQSRSVGDSRGGTVLKEEPKTTDCDCPSNDAS